MDRINNFNRKLKKLEIRQWLQFLGLLTVSVIIISLFLQWRLNPNISEWGWGWLVSILQNAVSEMVGITFTFILVEIVIKDKTYDEEAIRKLRRGGSIDLRQEIIDDLKERGSIPGADMNNVKLDNLILDDFDFSDTTLTGANLNQASLQDAILNGTNLIDADLSEANLTRVKLNKADLRGANLSDATLLPLESEDLDLQRAILLGANLSGAKLANSQLQNVTLSGANLSRADISGANLSGAKLCQIQNADGIKWSIQTILPNGKPCTSEDDFLEFIQKDCE